MEYYKDNNGILYCKNNLNILPNIPDSSIHLSIFSPPYANLKQYSDDEENIGNYNFEDQKKFILDVCREVYRILQPGRKLCLNLMDIKGKIKKISEVINPIEIFVPEIKKIGFIFQEIIIWKKQNTRWNLNNGTVPYPCSPTMKRSFEYILIFRKQGSASLKHITEEIKKQSAFNATREWGKWSNCVWEFDTIPRLKQYHPAAFHPGIPCRLIKLYSFVGETILDPFAGIGTTLVEAKKLNRKYIGIELEDKYCKSARDFLSQEYLEFS